jgi:hypothetical protein
MNAWTLFSSLDQNFDVPFLDGVQALLSALIAYVRQPLLAGAVVWIAGTAMVEMYAPGGDPMTGLVRKLMRAAIVIFLVSSAPTFNQYIGNLLLNTLPTDISNAVSGVAGGPTVAAASFDQLLNQAWAAGLQVYKNLPAWSLKGVGLMILVALYWAVAAVTIAVSFLVYLATHVFLGLVVATGPLFVCCLLWQRTTRFFDGWLGAAGSLILTQVLVVALLAMLVQVESRLVLEIAGLNGSGGVNVNNEVGQLHLLLFRRWCRWRLRCRSFAPGRSVATGAKTCMGTQPGPPATRSSVVGSRCAGSSDVVRRWRDIARETGARVPDLPGSGTRRPVCPDAFRKGTQLRGPQLPILALLGCRPRPQTGELAGIRWLARATRPAHLPIRPAICRGANASVQSILERRPGRA